MSNGRQMLIQATISIQYRCTLLAFIVLNTDTTQNDALSWEECCRLKIPNR